MAAKYMYYINYQNYEKDLCALDMRGLFGFYMGNKVFNSKKKIQPSLSPYIKHRIEVLYASTSFRYLLHQLTEKVILTQGFSVKYVAFNKHDPYMKKGKALSKEIGLRLMGFPNFKSPSVVYGITYYEGVWYFGILESNNMLWKDHLNKPFSYSSSLGINLAKVLLNVVSGGDLTMKLMDPCCGVGTVLLEGAFAGYQIEGREIKEKVATSARNNLAHFKYDVQVTTGPIEEVQEVYEGLIVDLPYGNFSAITSDEQKSIIESANRISKRLVLVASENIDAIIASMDLEIIDSCVVKKSENSSFERQVCLCISERSIS